MPADVNVDDLTNVGGTGVFDKLMSAINDNINTQYENNRISGSDYANVYLGSMQAAMAQAVQFVLQEQVTEAQVDTARADIDVKERLTVSELLLQTEQITQVIADVDVKERLTVSELLTAIEQRAQLVADTLLKSKQLEIDEQELALKKSQADKDYAEMLAYIDKEMGFSYTLDVNDDLVRSSLSSTSDGKLDYEVANLLKQGVLLDTEEEIKQYQATSILPTELKLLEQKVVGKKQSAVIGE